MAARARRLALILVVGLVAAACGGGIERAEPTRTETPAGDDDRPEVNKKGKIKKPQLTILIGDETANDEGWVDLTRYDEVEEFELDEYSFEPTVVVGESGETARLELINDGDERHTFTLDEQAVDVVLGRNDRKDVDVNFPQSGFIVYYCRFHRSQGMLGALSVGNRLGSTKELSDKAD